MLCAVPEMTCQARWPGCWLLQQCKLQHAVMPLLLHMCSPASVYPLLLLLTWCCCNWYLFNPQPPPQNRRQCSCWLTWWGRTRCHLR